MAERRFLYFRIFSSSAFADKRPGSGNLGFSHYVLTNEGATGALEDKRRMGEGW